MKNQPNCLRCAESTLILLPESSAEINFFNCPQCCRHYAQKPGKGLTFRWLHPISLALYSILFEREPMSVASSLAESFIRQYETDVVERMWKEIQGELDHPTQQVRDILDNPQSEKQCREFLQAFNTQLRAALLSRIETLTSHT